MSSVEYSNYKHRHNFAIWAAARAAQRGFTNVINLKNALESSSIGEFVEKPSGESKFDKKHAKWCNRICDYLHNQGVNEATYGRAAKLVNVYLKSMVVLLDLSSEAAKFIHPPIDRILLQNIARDPNVNKEYSRKLRNTNWTSLDESEYFDLISILKEINGDQPFWKIEEYWDVTSETSS